MLAALSVLAAVDAASIRLRAETVYDVTTSAGVLPGSTDGSGAVARFNGLSGLDVDATGAVYAADSGNQTIRRISPDGSVTTVLGTARQTASGLLASWQLFLSNPSSVRIGAQGNFYVGQGDSRILKFTSARVFAAVAWTTFLSDFVLRADDVYYTDGLKNHVLRSQTDLPPALIAGSPFGDSGSVDGEGEAARFWFPRGIVASADGKFYVADSGNSTIRTITTEGTVSTLAGSAGAFGSVDGTGAAARFANPDWLDLDAAGNLYVAEHDAIRKVTPEGVVTTIAGKFGEQRNVDGVGAGARFYSIAGLSVDATGTVYVSDNDTLRRVTPAGAVTTIAGAASRGLVDGAQSQARFEYPTDIAVSASGTMYVTELFVPAIRRIATDGTVSRFAGSLEETGTADGPGSMARFDRIGGIALDAAGNVYVSDSQQHTIRKVTPAGVVTTLAGNAGVAGSVDGIGTAATFSSPSGLAVDSSGNVYVADSGNHTLRRVTPIGTVSTLAGTPSLGGSDAVDGTGAAARFIGPADIAIDSQNVLWVADGNSIRKVTTAGVVTTLVGFGASGQFISGITATADGELYVTDMACHIVRHVMADGANALIVGAFRQFGSVDGRGTGARLNMPRGIAITQAREIYVADSGNAAIRKITAGTPPVFDTHPQNTTAAIGGNHTLTARAGAAGVSYTWQQNGVKLAGANSASLVLTDLKSAKTGLYTAVADNGSAVESSDAAIVGLSTTGKVTGAGSELVPANIVHPNGNVFDQVLLEGTAASITADYPQNQITRMSFIDLDDDIVQVEFSGPGTLSLVLSEASGPALPVNYNQAVSYMKGHAGLVITGADERTNVSVFSVGRATAVNQALFKPEVNYDGTADLAFIAILSTNGKFGGVRAANAQFSAWAGFTGIYAPGVEFVGGTGGVGPLFVGNIIAYDQATPVLITGTAGDARITGGNLFQDNGRAVAVKGITKLAFTDGGDAHGNRRWAQDNLGVLQEDGVEVTDQVVVNPPHN